MTKKFDLEKLNQEFEKKSPQEIIEWAIDEFGLKIMATSSFGPESGTLLHMVSQVKPDLPILFINTGFHFEETLKYKRQLIDILGLKNVVDLKADPEKREKLVQDYHEKPYDENPDLCCQINKVEPLDEAVKSYDAWMSGIRRHQTDYRKAVRIIEEYEGNLYKISPLANFTSRDSWWYLKEHGVPVHPLYEKGYMSVGCWPCTKPIQEGDDERSGRWAGKSKTECGIHLFKEVKPSDEEAPKDIGEGI